MFSKKGSQQYARHVLPESSGASESLSTQGGLRPRLHVRLLLFAASLTILAVNFRTFVLDGLQIIFWEHRQCMLMEEFMKLITALAIEIRTRIAALGSYSVTLGIIFYNIFCILKESRSFHLCAVSLF